MIPRYIYDGFPEKTKPPIRPCKLKIKAGNGTNIKLFGVATIEFKIDDMKFNYDMHIVDNTIGPILGYDFLHDTGDSEISPSAKTVTIRGKKLKLLGPDEKITVSKVTLNRTIVIGATQEMNTEAVVRSKRDVNGRRSLLEPTQQMYGKTGALLCKLVVVPQKNMIPVRVFNPHDTPIKIFRGTTLGILRDVQQTVEWNDVENDEMTDDPEMPGLVDVDIEEDDFILRQTGVTDPIRRQEAQREDEADRIAKFNTDPQATKGYDRHETVTDDEDETQDKYPKIRAFANIPTTSGGDIDIDKVPEHLEKLYEASIAELNGTQRRSLRELLTEYEDIFARNANDIGKAKNIKHHIDTGNEDPVVQKPRRQAKAHTEEIKKQVEKLHKAGIIRPSESDWASNVVMAKKKDGTWRMCIDYRELNTKTKNKGTYMLPRIDDTLDSLSRAKFFCSLDIIQGYHHIELSDESKAKTAFHAPRCNPSHWEYNYMPFGLVGAPRTFQRMMDRILRGLEHKVALAYLDDIIIYGATVEDCLINMRIVFERIRQAGLKLKPSKCSLFQRETMFLGHIISAEGIKTDPKKVSDVLGMKPCRNVKDIQTFMGMVNYYARFLPQYSEVSKPIVDLTRKNKKFVWGTEQQQAFETLKERLCTAPVLAYPRDDCKYILDTDASNYALGAVLSQLQPDDENAEPNTAPKLVERPIAYYSKQFNDAEKHYCARRRELLAIVRSVKHFDPYLRGTKFIIRTDHASLRYIKTMKELPSQFHRWVFIMEEYSYDIEVRKGILHANADAMSRMPCDMKSCICRGVDELERVHGLEDSNSAEAVVSAIAYQPKYSQDEMAAAQRADPDIGPLYRAKIDDKVRPEWNKISGESPAAKAYIAEWRRIEVHNNILYRRWENDDATEFRLQMLVPFKYQREICRNYHDSSSKTHLGRRRCLNALQRLHFWHKMHEDIKWWIRTCDVCQRRKRPQPTPRAPMRIYVTGHPGERISMDIVGPIQQTERGNQYILTIVDHFSRFAKAIPLQRHTAQIVAEELTTKWFDEYGEPMQIHTDQGAEFESTLMKELTKLLGIEKCRTVAFKPSSDGMVERYNKTIVDCISMAKHESAHWDLVVGKCVSAYNSTVHATTGFTPNKLWLGREVFHNADLMLPRKPEEDPPTREKYVQRWEDDMRLAYRIARETIGRNVKVQKKYYDRRANLIAYKEGDQVMLKDYSPHIRGHRKLADRWVGPYFILDVLSDINFRVILNPNSKPKVVHHDRLKRYHARNGKPDVSWVIARSRSFREGEDTSTLPKNSTEVESIPKPDQPVRSTCRPAVLETSDATQRPKVKRKQKTGKNEMAAKKEIGAPHTAPVKRPRGRPPGKAKPKQLNDPPRSAPPGVRRSKRGKPTE